MKSQTNGWDLLWASADNTLWGNSRKEKVDPGSVFTALFLMWGGLCCPPPLPPRLLLPFQLLFPTAVFKAENVLPVAQWLFEVVWEQMETLIHGGFPGSHRVPGKQKSLNPLKCSIPNTRSCCLIIKVTSPSVSTLRRLSPNSHNPSASHWPPYPASRQR